MRFSRLPLARHGAVAPPGARWRQPDAGVLAPGIVAIVGIILLLLMSSWPDDRPAVSPAGHMPAPITQVVSASVADEAAGSVDDDAGMGGALCALGVACGLLIVAFVRRVLRRPASLISEAVLTRHPSRGATPTRGVWPRPPALNQLGISRT